MRSKLLVRILSALAGVLIIGGSYWYLGQIGLLIFSIIMTTLAIFEVAKLILPKQSAKNPLIHNFFVAIGCATLSTVVFFPDLAMPVTALMIVFLISGLLLIRWPETQDLNDLLKLQAACTLGLIYTAVMPSFVIRLLSIPNGEKWYFTYLGIVFAGDTLAYFSGKTFGARKLMPTVSPQKTIEGSIGGLIGSALAGLCAYAVWLHHINPILLVTLALITGAVAQIGDLFESLLKRVVHVKDSGQIMPGHGGVLDRLDGIYFAAPLFFLALHFLE